ncbi:hypothetical protein L9F63_022786 [Diploptera punctata]|uniref:Uncharacterized protein n=1 Tax=Diploptera punctata TaxID=6984 RepID=A0AAD7ZLF1_DIPPU|nr:hypothetical protein L9F63_022786 [Diploptera punctata]
MYATFEEFIDTHTSFGKFGEAGEIPKQNSSPGGASKPKRDELVGGVPRPRPRTSSSSRHRSRPGPRQVIGGSALELAVPSREMALSAPAAASIEFNFETPSKLGNSKDDMSLIYRRPQHHRCRYRRSRRRMDIANPLLETISAIQDPCESDDHDFGDPGPQYYGVRDHRLPGSRFVQMQTKTRLDTQDPIPSTPVTKVHVLLRSHRMVCFTEMSPEANAVLSLVKEVSNKVRNRGSQWEPK